ncbi:MAG: hypothetical protein KAS75_07870 [Planctomycetes bacterium]|nr:hypothetical protein [Planctomycetota bacterium]
MKPAENINNLIKKLNLKASTELDQKVHNEISKILAESEKTKSAPSKLNTWRIIMTNKITKLAAAAVIIIAVVFGITVLDKSVTPAYAIEQTISAISSMRYVHTRYFDASHEDVTKECWIEMDDTGQLKNVRINWAEWITGEQIVVWNKDKTEMWNPKRNRLSVFNDKIYTARILQMANKANPRLYVERLHERQSKGEVKIEVEEPSNKSEPIVVTSTGLGENINRYVLFVDQATKLVTHLEWYQSEDDVYKYQGVTEFFDYNVPIDAKMFTLYDEIPTDAQIDDAKTHDIGLEQGDLTDKEMAVKVVQEFIESLIAKDYTRVGLICGGIPPGKVEKGWGRFNVVRLVSIGEPVPSSKVNKVYPKTVNVSCTFEFEKDGRIIQKLHYFYVGTVIGNRQNWTIYGEGRDTKSQEEFDRRTKKEEVKK